MTTCRGDNPDYERMESNRYRYALAILKVDDIGQGFRTGFVRCMECKAKFVLVWPSGLRVAPCICCDNREVRTRDHKH